MLLGGNINWVFIGTVVLDLEGVQEPFDFHFLMIKAI